MPFNVPCVPTGIKTGVATSLCRNFISPTRALVVEHLASTSYVRGGGRCAEAPDSSAADVVVAAAVVAIERSNAVAREPRQ